MELIGQSTVRNIQFLGEECHNACIRFVVKGVFLQHWQVSGE